MSRRHFKVVLTHGRINSSRYGQHRNGIPFRISDEDSNKLAYFQANGRYSVVEVVIPKPKPNAQAATSVGTPGRTGPKKGLPITPERLKALAEMPVFANMKKTRLMGVARDLGIVIDTRGGKKPPANKSLVKAIEERQLAVLGELEAAADAEAEAKAKAEADGE